MYKQVIVVRGLRMSRGKLAAQCSHAAVSAALKTDKRILDAWLASGQKKAVLKAGIGEIRILAEKCKKLGLPYCVVADAGRTELKPGTITCIGIGPGREEKINKVTGSLALLK